MNYVNADGFVTVDKFPEAIPGDGNGWLQTGLARACGFISIYGEKPAPVFENMIKRCRAENSPLIWRSPHKKSHGDETQCDDYYGACLLSQEWSRELLEYAEKNRWNFDIGGERRIKYWFGRFPAFPPFLRSCAGEPLGFWSKTALVAVTFFDSLSISHADANMKAFCLLTQTEKSCYLGKLVAERWRRKVRARYGIIGKSWQDYFGPEHPLCTFD